ncbi:RNA-binding protein NOB1 isoform X3 [Zootoca vivipara]|uniref:RNA-binding protein NOB1 isoform X3 n=1 Tax=Zootoca vivipara TaxID=8524 RepID=UPI00293BD9D8|nr:RNA-binding protein NOB1 isoform X3 [Zootoca vivipara]
MAPVEHVVADAGAFLRGAPLQDIGKNIYTIREVVTEIRDKETRRRLAVLPYELHFKQPFPEYVRLVTEFSKKTGDYPSLSATDIQVLALTYQLEAENVGVAHLKKEPEQKVKLSSTKQHPETPVHVAGFHLPSKTKCPGGEKSPSVVGSRNSADSTGPETSEFGSFLFWRNPLPSIEEDLQDLLKVDAVVIVPEDPKDNKSSEEEEEQSGEDSNDEEGWITPSNIKQIQQGMDQADEPAGVQVGCVTTDFAMQNILLQMGLHVLAVNGMLIRHTRSYVLRCHGCFKYVMSWWLSCNPWHMGNSWACVQPYSGGAPWAWAMGCCQGCQAADLASLLSSRTTSEMTRLFCPHCGNKTLKKVAVSVDDDGSIHMHFSRNPKVLNPRGLRVSSSALGSSVLMGFPHLLSSLLAACAPS